MIKYESTGKYHYEVTKMISGDVINYWADIARVEDGNLVFYNSEKNEDTLIATVASGSWFSVNVTGVR